MPVTGTRIGVVWYRREDWDELMTLFPDADALDDSYDDWLANARNLMDEIAELGHIGEPVYLFPAEFRHWCAMRNRPMNAEARSEFASEFVRRKYRAQDE